MSRITDLAETIATFDDLKHLTLHVKQAEGAEEMNANSNIVKMDLDQLSIDLGEAEVNIFGKTEFGEWMYFATTYNKANQPVAPSLHAKFEAADRVMAYIREQKARWTEEEDDEDTEDE